jgi:hypothetical protein
MQLHNLRRPNHGSKKRKILKRLWRAPIVNHSRRFVNRPAHLQHIAGHGMPGAWRLAWPVARWLAVPAGDAIAGFVDL